MQQSTPGMVLGTIGYMSPEQASGRVHEIDHRSDIFSFGCMLFEAATGQRAFEGKDALDSLHKIVYAPTPQVKDVSPVAPDALQRVIGRCLAKDPARRYQSVKDLAIDVDDLRRELKSLTGPLSSDQPSDGVTPSGASRADEGFWVAVLPFKHRGVTPTSKRWPTASERTSSWASCGSPISASSRAAPRGVSAAKPWTFARWAGSSAPAT